MSAVFSSLGAKLRGYANRDGRGYPDWAMRYAPVARALRRGAVDGLVLEVGANENGIRRFVDVPTVAVDVSPDHLRAARAAHRAARTARQSVITFVW